MKSLKTPRIAVFFDWLNQWGGAERVLLDLLKLYPGAPLYTLVHDPKKTSWLPPQTRVVTSFINSLPISKNNPVAYTPIYDIALEQFDFSGFDIVISTTSVIGHSLLTPPSTLFVCYFHNINRHLYDRPYLKFYQSIDRIYSRRPDEIFCNSQTVASRINATYGLTPRVINPGVDTDFFTPTKNPNSDYYLMSHRLVAHKNIDIVIKTFKNRPEKLIITGNGRSRKYLKSLASDSPNIIFTGLVSDAKLLKLYQNCTALICPQIEDFGLSALEAQACGRPVIALNRGGNTETVINGKTGIFFETPTPESLTKVLNSFSPKTYSPDDCRQQAVKFSRQSFMLHFSQTIDRLWQSHQTTIS